jgi:hypothetical protein
MSQDTFQPKFGGTLNAVVTASNQVITVPADAKNLLITVVGSVPVFVRLTTAGETSVASITADMPILPGSGGAKCIRKPIATDSNIAYTRLCVIASGAGSTVYVTPGDGFMS